MIQFFVNNQELLLPEDFEVTIIEENPEITNNGEFTLDITLSLLESKNAIAFGFLNRLNLTTIAKKADARMVIDNHVSMGSMVILSNTDVNVTFQFIAGNSELNYNAKADDRKIWELDWGAETVIDYDRALGSISGTSENFVCTPILLGTEIINNYSIANGNGTASENGGVANMFPINGIGAKIIMQPYLLYYINKLPSLLGYTLNSNVLNTDARALKMFLVNAVDSLNYADALPDMTIAKFIEEIEFIFNVSFLVDKSTKTVMIETLASNLSNKKKVTIENVLDSYERNLSEDSKAVRFGFDKISYNLPESTYFKYQNLSDDIVSKCEIKEYANYSALYADIVNQDLRDKLIIYRDLETLNEYFFGDPTISLYYRYAGMYGAIKLINKFCCYGDSAKNELVLSTFPAEINRVSKTLTWTINGNTTTFNVYFQCPKSSNSYYIPKYMGFVENVENGDKSIVRLDSLEVSMFMGKIKMYNENGYGISVETAYPFSFSDLYPEFGPLGNGDYGSNVAQFEVWKNTYFMPNAPKTLRLTGSNGVVSDYKQAIIIDTAKEYIFVMPDSPDISANNIFNINNLDYMPISLERVKSNKLGTVKGRFYEMI